MKNMTDIKIDKIDLPINIIAKLNNNNIFSINDLWESTRSDLKKMKLDNKEIGILSIKLQLLGLDLNKKTY